MADVIADTPAPQAPSRQVLSPRDFVVAGATFVAVALLAVAAILMTRYSGNIVIVWAANAAALYGWSQARRSVHADLLQLAATAGGFLTANLLVGTSPTGLAVYSLANTLEVCAAAALFRRVFPAEPDFGSLSGLIRFLVVVCMPAPLLSALIVGVSSWANGNSFVDVSLSWYLGSVAGFTLIGTVFLTGLRDETRRLFSGPRAAEALSVLALVGLVCLFAFQGRQPLGFLVYPALLLAAVRLRVFGAAVAALLVWVVSVILTLKGMSDGELTAAAAAEAVRRNQLYLGFACLPTIAVAAILNERDRWAAAAALKQAQAEAASNGKSKLLANVSHEVRTPLNAIIGFGDILLTGRTGELNPVQQDLLKTMVSSAEQLNALAQDLIDVAKAEAGKLAVSPVRMDMAKAAREIVDRCQVKAQEHGAVLLMEESGPLPVTGDPMRVAQILSNLTTNAIKYAGKRGPITLRLYRVGDRVRAEVQDHGPGIAPERRSELFEPFNRLGKETGQIDGTGIGLSIARRLAELQNGTLGFETEVETGSRFWLELPAASAKPDGA